MLLPAFTTFLTTGRGPDGNDGHVYYIRTSVLDMICQEEPEWRYGDAELLIPCLQNPRTIYEGLNRDEYRDAFAHVITPEVEWGQGATWFFLVYTQPMSGADVLMDYAWRPEDQHFRGRPQGWQEFERGQVWPET
jgi:hypothetical protein